MPGPLDYLNFALNAGGQVLNLVNLNRAWEREDNAVQRRVRDLRAAGLSPVLAAGSAASSSGPIRVEGPQITSNVQAQNAGIARTKADTELARINAENADANSYMNRMVMWRLRNDASERGNLSRDLADSVIERMISENKLKVSEVQEYKRNISLAQEFGVPSMGSEGFDTVAQARMMKILFPKMDEEKLGGMSVLYRTLQGLVTQLVRNGR